MPTAQKRRRSVSAAAIIGTLIAALALGPGAAQGAAPSIGQSWASAVFSSTARLSAQVNPNGLFTTYHFDYITQAAYEANLAAAKDPFSGASRVPLVSDPSAIRLRGPTRRGAYPSLRATFASRGPGDTNLKEIAVSLPRSEFLAQNHIRQICTKVQFAHENCPAGSVYGSAVAFTPLFDEPLRGNVYLRSSPHKLPDLVASLFSGAVRIVLEGKIGSTKQGGISALFKDLPDEPVDRFVMVLNGGRRGLLTNSANICAVPPEATVKALGQTNLGASFTTMLRGQCKGKRK